MAPPRNRARRPQYICKEDHRNGAPMKSQWTIGEADERSSFVRAQQEGWLRASKGWGLHLIDEQANDLGRSWDGARILFFARFTTSTSAPWHGYPADWVRRSSDIPDADVLMQWEEFGV